MYSCDSKNAVDELPPTTTLFRRNSSIYEYFEFYSPRRKHENLTML